MLHSCRKFGQLATLASWLAVYSCAPDSIAAPTTGDDYLSSPGYRDVGGAAATRSNTSIQSSAAQAGAGRAAKSSAGAAARASGASGAVSTAQSALMMERSGAGGTGGAGGAVVTSARAGAAAAQMRASGGTGGMGGMGGTGGMGATASRQPASGGSGAAGSASASANRRMRRRAGSGGDGSTTDPGDTTNPGNQPTGAAAGSGSRTMGATGPTYRVQDGTLYDGCGEKVVLRGINHPTLYEDRRGEALPEIAKTGANSVRLFWYAGHGIGIHEAEPAISSAIQNHMIPILEMHDSTCAWSLDKIISYWTSDDALALIERYQAQIIVNIANEPSAPSEAAFKNTYTSAIQTLRKAGIRVPLMIDGSNCGRDYRVLLSQGPALVEADPDHNLIFSAHLYDPMSAGQLADVYDSFVKAKLAFVVGEFANKEPPGCGAAIDYLSLIGEADKRDIGWLAWSWGDNSANSEWNSDCGEFDMTNTFAFDSLRDWGKEVAVTSPASIMHTAVRPVSIVTGACK